MERVEEARGAAKFRAKADRMAHATCLPDGVFEVTLETSDRSALEAFYTLALGLNVLSREADRTWLACGSRPHCEDPAANVFELWDFFQRGQGVDGVEALAASGG